ncbi:hypothetical protein GCM10010124_33510 [Pilimelia terevasa]|uniref:histidine kinase n=1 Tax=Pilimelia terevasa TaxID=53372 RepID=A0A8J3BPQ4_9ACTN|nr:HAMP domain-containing sensor histidine kinase [Pilimelia terevasa]GGK37956.1 hypothetical protein GCM10010124_33510 [Pilimelia terevasa]
MGGPPTVGRLLHRAFGLLVALIGVAGVGGAVATLLQQQVVRELSTRVGPSVSANLELRIVLLDAQRALRGYLAAGAGAGAEYDAARAAYPPAVAELRRMTGPDPAASIDAQVAAADRWWAYAEAQRPRRPGGTVTAATVLAGQRLMEDTLAANSATGQALDARARRLADRAASVDRARLVALLALVVGAALLAYVVSRRTTQRIVAPLDALTSVLTRLRDGELTARAPTHARVAEIAAVAEATNAMAAEIQQSRGRQDRLFADERRLVGDLRQLEHAKNEFMTTVSHELRTPLTSIAGYLEILRDDTVGALTPRQEKTLAVLERNTDRLRSLIEDLLVLSQVEAGTMTASPAESDISALVETAAAQVREAAAEAGVTLRAATPGPAVAHVDAGQILRAVGHLVANAVKFTPRGGEVTVEVTTQPDHVTVRVADTGMGIPYADQPHLFTTFYRASNAVDQAIQGSGLGLVIVRTIATRHGGGVHLRSTPGQGTSVLLSLPTGEVDG